jgi:hypothetical protein
MYMDMETNKDTYKDCEQISSSFIAGCKLLKWYLQAISMLLEYYYG